MNVHFRVRQLLDKYLGMTDCGAKSLDSLSKKTGIPLYALQTLINNGRSGIKTDTVGKLVSYLISEGTLRPDRLPLVLGEFFGVEPEHFWELISGRSHIDMCMGARPDTTWDDEIVSANDAILQAELLYQSTVVKVSNGCTDAVPQVINTQLIRAWERECDSASLKQVQKEAKEFFSAYKQIRGDKGLVILGSIKSNAVNELLMASVFAKATPFRSEDDVQVAQDRSCPFLIAYRDKDSQPPSCHGGRKLSRDADRAEAGIYYEDTDGNWSLAPWEKDDRDCALVFYTFEKSSGQLKLVLGGYTGRGTRWLARFLREQGASQFWEPCYETEDLQIGTFVVKFEKQSSGKVGSEVIPVCPEAIQKRI